MQQIEGNALEVVVDQLLLLQVSGIGKPVLVTGCLAAELAQILVSKQADIDCDIKTGDDIFHSQTLTTKFSLALVVNRFSGVEEELVIGKNLLGRVRDVYAERVLHIVINDSEIDVVAGRSGWSLTDSLELGFVKLGKFRFETGDVAVYEFNIHRYKHEPDWLNARHWANPERWGQARS